MEAERNGIGNTGGEMSSCFVVLDIGKAMQLKEFKK